METFGRTWGTEDDAAGLAVRCSNEHCSATVTASATAIDNACTYGGVRGALPSAITDQLSPTVRAHAH